MKILLLSTVFFLLPLGALGFFAPKTYEGCIDKFVNLAESDYGARAVAGTCVNEFHKGKTTKKDLAFHRCVRSEVVKSKNDRAAKITTGRCLEKSGLR